MSVRPPPAAARQLTVSPLIVAATVRPATVTRARVGVNASSTVTVDPRAATAARRDGAIGAPHRERQHHDDTASRVVPADVLRTAFGGPASAAAAASAITGSR